MQAIRKGQIPPCWIQWIIYKKLFIPLSIISEMWNNWQGRSAELPTYRGYYLWVCHYNFFHSFRTLTLWKSSTYLSGVCGKLWHEHELEEHQSHSCWYVFFPLDIIQCRQQVNSTENRKLQFIHRQVRIRTDAGNTHWPATHSMQKAASFRKYWYIILWTFP